ncbi:uncharacterized protein LOC122511903 [Leptopilina heterotoma]|uniref:uncharacterized protein LOC122511903 n=1 Tax=Leptopilina heterotoma TaxID=63436 RepID=UPI001CAA0BFB|nr:uncharacterized protein LOC122511903 [Leptopilina heterotoma]
MSYLFVRPNGTPLQFHLTDLSDNLLIRYIFLIESNGGEVTLKPDELILTFTLSKFCYKYPIVYNIEFIDDCLTRNKLLDINEYYIGDTRHFNVCRMPEGVKEIKTFKCPESKKEHVMEGEQIKNLDKISTVAKKSNKMKQTVFYKKRKSQKEETRTERNL